MSAAYENFVRRMEKETSVAVFGAGKFAKTLCYFLDRKGIKTDVFVVTECAGNQQELLGRPVISLEQFREQMAGKVLVVGREQRKDMKADVSFLGLLAFCLKGMLKRYLWCLMKLLMISTAT